MSMYKVEYAPPAIKQLKKWISISVLLLLDGLKKILWVVKIQDNMEKDWWQTEVENGGIE